MKFKCLFVFVIPFLTISAKAQIVDIPDPNFLEALIMSGVDMNSDGNIQVAEAVATDILDVSGRGIEDLTGIESFLNLADLECSFNNLTTVDLSNNRMLYRVGLYENQLTEIDLSKNEFLSDLVINDNNIETLDLSANVQLVTIIAFNNRISNFIFPEEGAVMELALNDNPITTLTLPIGFTIDILNLDNTDLIYLDLGEEVLTTDLFLDKKLRYLSYNGFLFPSITIENATGESDLEVICTIDTLFAEDMLFNNNIPLSQVQIVSDCNFPDNLDLLTNFLEGEINISNTADCTDVLSTDNDITLNCYDENDVLVYQLSSLSTSRFSMLLPSGEYRIEPEFLNKELFDVTPTSFQVNLTGADTVFQDFCIVPKSQSTKFIKVDMLSTDLARPGFTSEYLIKYSNIGNIATDGEIIVTYQPNLMEFITASPDMRERSAFELSLEFQDLQPFEEREIRIEFEFNSPMDTPPLNNGDILEFCAYAVLPDAPGLSDFDFTKLRQEVVNSYDPNDKTCLQGNIVMDSTLGKYLDYMIRFENTGTAEAVNITIEDRIDTEVFDINTLRIVDASHEVQAFTEGNLVSFYFEDIYLPFDDANNDGYVVFELRTKEQLAIGDTIANTADIFFDFNFPIVTNTTESFVATDMDMDGFHNLEDCDDENAEIYPGAPEIIGNGIDEDCDGEDLTGTHELNGTSVTIYPNPVTYNLFLEWDTQVDFSIQLMDPQGKEILKGNNIKSIDFSSLSNGIYIIKLTHSDANNFIIEKIMVEK